MISVTRLLVDQLGRGLAQVAFERARGVPDADLATWIADLEELAELVRRSVEDDLRSQLLTPAKPPSLFRAMGFAPGGPDRLN